MSGVIWSKWFWPHWLSDPAVRACCASSRGLWMDMLCVAAAHDPVGYVAVNGRGLTDLELARLAGMTELEVIQAVAELELNAVFSRDRQGRIFSRRMIRDAKRAANSRKNGKKGGNPTLLKTTGISESDNLNPTPPLRPNSKARSYKKEETYPDRELPAEPLESPNPKNVPPTPAAGSDPDHTRNSRQAPVTRTEFD